MERAKRLERIREILQGYLGIEAYIKADNANSSGAALPEYNSISEVEIMAWAKQLNDIVCGWPTLNDGLRQGLLIISRAQFGSAEKQV